MAADAKNDMDAGKVVIEYKQKLKLKTYQVSRNFTICCQRLRVDTLKFR